MTARLRGDMERVAVEVGAILNAISDDDVRDEMHGLFERTLNDELYAASRDRLGFLAPVIPLRPVVLHSVKT